MKESEFKAQLAVGSIPDDPATFLNIFLVDVTRYMFFPLPRGNMTYEDSIGCWVKIHVPQYDVNTVVSRHIIQIWRNNDLMQYVQSFSKK